MTNESVIPFNTNLSFLMRTCLSILSGILLSLAFLDADYFLFAWIAFVPFLLAIKGVRLWRSYSLGLLSGLAFSMSTAYWIVDFLMLSKGYLLGQAVLWSFVFWFYCAQLSAFLALSFTWLSKRSKVHEFVLFPMVVVTFFAVFPMLFPIRLGESQSQFLSAIQGVDLIGVHGLDAILALSNIMLFKLFYSWLTKEYYTSFQSWLFASLIIMAWFVYGIVKLYEWDQILDGSPTIRVGIVQPNELPSLERAQPYSGFSWAYPPEMAMTERLAVAGAEVVIWPEAKYKAYLDDAHVRRAYKKQLAALNVSLVFQDIEHKVPDVLSGGDKQTFNTALMLNHEGELLGQYQKMKRIAFGEYVPWVSDIPFLKNWVESFWGPFLNEISAGSSHQSFSDEKVNILPLICYEVMFPDFVANTVSHSFSKSKTPTMLVGLSSNGWFGNTRQPYQHVNASILRAIENRMPLVHVVNNGPSVVALPTGEVMFMSDSQEAGGYIVDVPYSSSRLSIYSRFPAFFLYSVYAGLLFISLVSIIKGPKRRIK